MYNITSLTYCIMHESNKKLLAFVCVCVYVCVIYVLATLPYPVLTPILHYLCPFCRPYPASAIQQLLLRP